jgi:pimeloyl-ACP methyl ester carboxylesterase
MPRRPLAPIVLIGLCHITASSAAAAEPAGLWVGRCRISDTDVFVQLGLRNDRDGLQGIASSRRLGVRAAPVSDVKLDRSHVDLGFATPQGAVRLSCRVGDNELEGTVECGSSSGACAFRRRPKLDMATLEGFRGDYQLASDRVLFVCGGREWGNRWFMADGDLRVEITPISPREFLADDLRTVTFEIDRAGKVVAALVAQAGEEPRRAPRVQFYDQESVAFSNGDVRLAGVLLLPEGPGPHPALVFVHGSGAGTRSQYPFEGDCFARHGIAVLAFDKRGSGESSGDWRAADFDELAADVLAGVRYLRRDPRIRADKVGLWGVSQAGWIIPLAASRSEEVAFIVPISGGAVMPAEQELWRHRQNLEYLGVPERFIAGERKAAVLAYDWLRRYQLGRMPIPQPFADDNLNMFHDAAGVLNRVRQPVLAIFGGLDRLTPPHESAGLWAEALGRRGNDDYSVRVFPRGSHGLMDGSKTGSPLELLAELRWVPGYMDTMIKWIHHHVDGPAFDEVRRVDVGPGPTPVESRRMARVSWFGSGAVQPWQLLVSLAVFASAAIAAPAAWLWQRVRRVTAPQPDSLGRTRWLACLLGLLNVGVTVALTYVLYQLVMAMPDPMYARLNLIWNVISAATWLALALLVLIGRDCIAAWSGGAWSRTKRVYYTLVALTGLCWVPFAVYWDLLRPAWS